MFNREKIYAVYEKPEAAEPTDRMVLLRDGFSLWAFMFNAFWLLAHRLWLPAVGYIALSVALAVGSDLLGLSEFSATLVQLWLQAMLGYHANDLRGWALRRRGYRLAGILAAESEMYAQRRYDEYAA